LKFTDCSGLEVVNSGIETNKNYLKES